MISINLTKNNFNLDFDFDEKIEQSLNYLKTCRQEIGNITKKVGELSWNKVSCWFEFSKHLLDKLKRVTSVTNITNVTDVTDFSRVTDMANISNAFCKGVELFTYLKKSKEYDPHRHYVRHFDNASLPGDFIRAATFVWNTHYSDGSDGNVDRYEHEWKASSLIPDSKLDSVGSYISDTSYTSSTLGALEDRFNLWKDYPKNWIMSAELMNGDMTKLENILQLPSLLGEWRPNLYTSDLGFKFNYEDENSLEEDQQMLGNFGQVLAGLIILEPGGDMITKMFSFVRVPSMWLLYFLVQNFSTVEIVKPQTSKRDNSEVYVMALNYTPQIGGVEMFIKKFQLLLCDASVTHFACDPIVNDSKEIKNESCWDLNKEELLLFKSIAETCKFFAKKQWQKIINNIKYFRNRERMNFDEEVAEWCKRYLHNL